MPGSVGRLAREQYPGLLPIVVLPTGNCPKPYGSSTPGDVVTRLRLDARFITLLNRGKRNGGVILVGLANDCRLKT